MEYKFGIIFDFGQHLFQNDTEDIFVNVDHRKLLSHLVRFITDEDWNNNGSGVETLLNDLIDEGILHYHVVFRSSEPYVDICSLLMNLCESLVDYLTPTRFFDYCSSYRKDKPTVIHISRDAYAILTSPIGGIRA